MRAAAGLRRYWLLLLVLLGMLAAGGAMAGGAMGAVLLTWLQGIFVVPVVLAAGMLGMALTVPLARAGAFQGEGWPDGWRLLLAVGVGLGALALAMLGLGALGCLDHGIPALLLLAAAATGYRPTVTFWRQMDREAWTKTLAKRELLLLLACVPLAVLLVAVTFPPGTLWGSEGGGYDVLEYHLEMPREYAAANSTAPVPHNVYSFLPANVEMLYLLLLTVTKLWPGGHLAAVYPAAMLHATLTVLAAGAVALAPLRLSRLGRMLAFVAVVSVPWTLVTGSLAYNDAGVLLYATLATGLALGPRSRAAGVMLGITLGLAVGCKMTAGVMVAIPVGVLLLLQGRWKTATAAALIAAAVYGPWAVRAAAVTGNPVFPIAARTLGLGHWTPAQAARWDAGHTAKLPSEQRGLLPRAAGRLKELWQQSVLDSQWSIAWGDVTRWLQPKPMARKDGGWWQWAGIFWLAVGIGIALALTRGIVAWQVAAVGAVQLLGWLTATHLQARFLLPTVVPFALLLALGTEAARWGRGVLWGIVGLQALGCGMLLQQELKIYGPERETQFARAGTLLLVPDAYRFPDRLTLPTDPPLTLPEHLHTYLVGTATPLYYHGPVEYHTVFDRDPLVTQFQTHPPADVVAWLRNQQINYLVVDWAEVARLRATYGYAPEITPQAIHSLGLQKAFATQRGVEVFLVAPVERE